MTTRDLSKYRPCVGIMVVNKDSLVWMGRRADSPDHEEIEGEPLLWQMPQGGIDKGEAPEDAAWRELFEETGIKSAVLLGRTSDWLTYDLPKSRIGKGLKGKWLGQKQIWFLFQFTGEEKEINITNPPDGLDVEFSQWDWIPLDELCERIVDFKRDVYLSVVDELGHLVQSP